MMSAFDYIGSFYMGKVLVENIREIWQLSPVNILQPQEFSGAYECW